MEIEIWACCYSEKADVSISFGTSVESIDGCAETLDVEWIYEGMSDSFWENHEEFELGISQAEALRNSDCSTHLFSHAVGREGRCKQITLACVRSVSATLGLSLLTACVLSLSKLLRL